MNKRWIIAGIIITAALAIAILVYSYIQLIQITPPPAISPRVAKHIFKIKEIYPTKPGGREWFIDMANPQADRLFDPDSPIFKEPDGSWQIGGGKAGVGDDGGDKNEEEDQVRMKV